MVSAPGPASKPRGSGGDTANMANHRRPSGVSGVRGGGGLPTSSASPRGKEKELGQFVLSKTMGEGTFGEVKLAVHKPTSERVAAKVWHKSLQLVMLLLSSWRVFIVCSRHRNISTVDFLATTRIASTIVSSLSRENVPILHLYDRAPLL